LQTFNIIKLKNIFLALFFSLLLNTSLSSNQAVVNNIYIELDLKENTDHRAKAVESSYKIALSRYLKWITLQDSYEISNLVNSLEVKDYISGYSIENEKYKKEVYSALITVNFEKKKLEQLLKNESIEFFSKKGPKTLIIPIINFQKRLVLWDDPNPWFDIWLRRPLDSNLNLFTLPTGEADDLITLSAEDAIGLKYFKIKKLARKYAATQAYILLVEVENINNEFYFKLIAYDGFTQEIIFSTEKETTDMQELNNNLSKLANNFADFFDNLWVKNNLDIINKETIMIAEVSFSRYQEWIKIKNFLLNNEKILKFNTLKMTNKRALIKLNILSIENLIEDLINNNFKIEKNNNRFLINKDERT
tara:strand:- start:284 stop:1372 length:1089 start_codon:yes stop_codon:yes gene_type:complete